MRTRIVFFAGCVALVGFFMLVRWALNQPVEKNSKSGVRRPLEYEIASGMSVRYRHLHAESVSFKAARVRRRRMGAFILGAFRVFELDDVLLNLPLPAEMGAVAPPMEKKPEEKPADGGKAPAAFEPRKPRNPLDGVLEKVGLSGLGGFSGVTIRGIRVGRMTDTGAEPLFNAQRAEARRAALQLSQCEVFRDGKKELVPEARLEWKDGLRLVWAGGSLDLPDLQESSKSEAGK